MKQILAIVAISLVLYSCSKKPADITLPETNFSTVQTWDSLNLQFHTFYRLVLNKANIKDSSAAIIFNSSTNFTEYSVTTDTNGLHLMDSSTYSVGDPYCEHQLRDPNYYASSVGYVFARYSPVGGTGTNFHFRNYLGNDTLILRIGTPVELNRATGTFHSALSTDTTVNVTIYK